MAHLALKNLRLNYADHCVVKSANLILESGECVGLIGASGSGKSTIFNALAGFLRPAGGEIIYQNEPISPTPGRFGYMLQNDLLLPYKSVIENLLLVPLFNGDSRLQAQAAAKSALALVGLADYANAYPAELSGGQRQRIAFARTMLFKSDLFLLDEPFAALDALSKRSMQEWLKEHLKANNLSAILITHDIAEALRICEKIYILCPESGGAVLKQTPKNEQIILNLLGIN